MKDLDGFAYIQTNDKYSHKEIEYYQVTIAEILVKLCRSNKDKYQLIKQLLDIMPDNVELLKWFVNYCKQENTTNKAVQLVYDHLTIHSIKNDTLWLW